MLEGIQPFKVTFTKYLLANLSNVITLISNKIIIKMYPLVCFRDVIYSPLYRYSLNTFILLFTLTLCWTICKDIFRIFVRVSANTCEKFLEILKQAVGINLLYEMILRTETRESIDYDFCPHREYLVAVSHKVATGSFY